MDLPKVEDDRGHCFVFEGAEIIPYSAVERDHLVFPAVHANATEFASTILVRDFFALGGFLKQDDLVGCNFFATYLFKGLLAGISLIFGKVHLNFLIQCLRD